MSESKVGETFDRIFSDVKDSRIIIATFASNVHRIQQIITAAEKYNRKVVLSGRSMLNVMNTAQKLGYVKMKASTINRTDAPFPKNLSWHIGQLRYINQSIGSGIPGSL